MLKDHKIITIVTVLILALATVAYFSSDPSEVPTAQAVDLFELDHELYDFGSMTMSGGKVSHMFRAKNKTDADALIDKVTTSCMCTEAYIVRGNERIGPFGMEGHGSRPMKINSKISPGEEFDVEVVYDPSAHGPAGIGPMHRSVFVETGGREVLKLDVTGTVTP